MVKSQIFLLLAGIILQGFLYSNLKTDYQKRAKSYTIKLKLKRGYITLTPSSEL